MEVLQEVPHDDPHPLMNLYCMLVGCWLRESVRSDLEARWEALLTGRFRLVNTLLTKDVTPALCGLCEHAGLPSVLVLCMSTASAVRLPWLHAMPGSSEDTAGKPCMLRLAITSRHARASLHVPAA